MTDGSFITRAYKKDNSNNNIYHVSAFLSFLSGTAAGIFICKYILIKPSQRCHPVGIGIPILWMRKSEAQRPQVTTPRLDSCGQWGQNPNLYLSDCKSVLFHYTQLLPHCMDTFLIPTVISAQERCYTISMMVQSHWKNWGHRPQVKELFQKLPVRTASS